MRKTTVLIGFAFAATVLAGCDDDVSKACTKMASFSDEGDALSKSTNLEECKTRLGQAKEKDPEDFQKTVACIEGASDMKAFMDCRMKGVADQLGEQLRSHDQKTGAPKKE